MKNTTVRKRTLTTDRKRSIDIERLELRLLLSADFAHTHEVVSLGTVEHDGQLLEGYAQYSYADYTFVENFGHMGGGTGHGGGGGGGPSGGGGNGGDCDVPLIAKAKLPSGRLLKTGTLIPRTAWACQMALCLP